MKMLVLGAALISTAAFAGSYDYSKKFGIGGSYGYNTPVFGNPFNTSADEGETWGFHGRYHLNSAYGLEAAFTKHEFADVTNALQVSDVTLFKRLNPTSRFSPILGLGAGIVDITHYPENNWKLGLKARVGGEYALTEAFSLGLNIDYQHVTKMLFGDNLDGRNINVLGARVGLTYYFGGAKTAAATTAAAAAVTQVLDTDSDKDGISDKKDKCPGTPEGVTVNAYGCAKEEKATVHLDVKFAPGKAAIDHNFDASMKEMAEFLAAHPSTKLEVQGHTDSTGSKELNKKLSQSRAEAVRTYLVEKLKVDGTRVTAKGYGSEMPIADNSTAAGKTANRRVVGVITE